MKESVSAGGVVVNKEGNILVVSTRGTSWSLPKGHVKEGETLLETASREINEESGIETLHFIKDLGVYRRYRIAKDVTKEDKSNLKIIHMFHYTTSEEELSPKDPKNPEAKWVSKDEVSLLLTHPKDKEFFLSIKNKIL